MNYLFNTEGLLELGSFCTSNTLFAFDYDGTLAKIVKDPAKAFMAKKTTVLLEELSTQATVAIISGRSLVDLTQLLPTCLNPRYMIGNHGYEISLSSEKGGHQNQEKVINQKNCEIWKENLSQILRDLQISDTDIMIEDKNYSLTLHYNKSQNSPLTSELKKRLLESLMQLSPPARLILGKKIINLVPQQAPNKGTAFLEILKAQNTAESTAFFIGDDNTDEDVFKLSSTKILSIRVGKKKSSHAKYFIKSQYEINKLLISILGFLKEKSC